MNNIEVRNVIADRKAPSDSMTRNHPSRPPLRIAVLECDTPLARTIKNYGGGYGDVFKALLEAGADTLGREDISSKNGMDLTKFNVVDQEVYPDLDNVDAVLITGSSTSHSA